MRKGKKSILESEAVESSAYITIANACRIIRKIPQDRLRRLNGTLYRRGIYVFGQRDKYRLLAIKELFREQDAFIKSYYVKSEVKDTGRYVFPESPPAYHCRCACPRLMSDFKNYMVPDFIYERGWHAISDYRTWFCSNMGLIENRWDHFQLRFKTKFGVWIQPQEIEKENSGVIAVDNLDLAALEGRIDSLIDLAAGWYRAETTPGLIIRNWGKNAWLGRRKDKPLIGNKHKLDESEVRACLRQYEQEIINPLKRLLIEYYRVSYNPDLTFSGALLDQLGFHACKACQHHASLNTVAAA